jgi:hypothetical protein
MKKAEHRKPSKKIRGKKRETRWRNFKSIDDLFRTKEGTHQLRFKRIFYCVRN